MIFAATLHDGSFVEQIPHVHWTRIQNISLNVCLRDICEQKHISTSVSTDPEARVFSGFRGLSTMEASLDGYFRDIFTTVSPDPKANIVSWKQ